MLAKRSSKNGAVQRMLPDDEKSINGSSHYKSMEVDNYSTHLDSITEKVGPEETKSVWSSLREEPPRLYIWSYNFIAPFTTILTTAFVAYWFAIPMIFPSLGPTAFLHFAVPDKPPASPKNTLCGHFIGILAGSLALQVCGTYHATDTLQTGISLDRMFGAALSVGLTCGFMILFKVPHPPSGATTLIVSLGLLKTPTQLSFMMAAVSLISLEALIINRIFRKDAIAPYWSADPPSPPPRSADEQKEMNKRQLQRKMNTLSVDTFVDCFEICNELKDDENMRKLIQFAEENNAKLWKKQAFQQKVPFAVRVAVMSSK